MTLTETVDKATENSVLKLVARVCMILAIPIGGYVGSKALDKLDKTNESTIRQEEMLRNIVSFQIPSVVSGFESRFNAQAARLDDNSKRINKLEDWRLSMPQQQRGNP